jgi:hypothetical protein
MIGISWHNYTFFIWFRSSILLMFIRVMQSWVRSSVYMHNMWSCYFQNISMIIFRFTIMKINIFLLIYKAIIWWSQFHQCLFLSLLLSQILFFNFYYLISVIYLLFIIYSFLFIIFLTCLNSISFKNIKSHFLIPTISIHLCHIIILISSWKFKSTWGMIERCTYYRGSFLFWDSVYIVN